MLTGNHNSQFPVKLLAVSFGKNHSSNIKTPYTIVDTIATMVTVLTILVILLFLFQRASSIQATNISIEALPNPNIMSNQSKISLLLIQSQKKANGKPINKQMTKSIRKYFTFFIVSYFLSMLYRKVIHYIQLIAVYLQKKSIFANINELKYRYENIFSTSSGIYRGCLAQCA